MKKGRLIKGIGGFYYVDVEGEIYECKARGIFRQKKITPLVGDYVEISITDEQKKVGVVEKIMERSTELIRPTVSNVNQAVIVFAVIQPEPNIMLLDRFLVLAESQELEIVICFNKVDLATTEAYMPIADRYRAVGYKVLLTSAKNEVSITDLRKVLLDKTSVFAGPSGVGKSTLLNKIHPNLQLKTGEISAKTARGKHTTRHAELIPIEKHSWVVDTPGFSALNIDFIEEEALALYFPEFDEYMEECKFSSCQHVDEPSCGIKNALQQNKIAKERYHSYLQFLQEIRSNRRF
ncbi:ribosome small subunit-dependent GTPase A [Clostridium formicaceticum]|uniref:Small ribosomal subunit biogenesis GTPase RsgA n=1 Tax=Clostridium formicaceticum TaxID=1497 RepID=A0AAC9WGF6_9CLOT|nr:ribosome small subunit-dependent GTPase A [Clostridium formicaceticum]AOY77366.1 ribosome small subunit-dependent GTPase A [Clostridium formicaceticum]ARE87912.1 Putative ribosome biogenesis GTPase RsgA [Clostridium formicaceticum]